jgi:hypothetical protein
MAITRTNMVDDDGSGTTGTIINNAWKQELYGQIDAALGGAVVDIPFSAASFFAGAGGTWTVTAGQVVTWAASRTAQVGTLFLHIDGSSVTGSPQFLHIQLPTGFLASRVVGMTFPFASGATAANGFCLVDSPSQRLFLGMDPLFSTNWTAALVSIRLVLTYPMAP